MPMPLFAALLLALSIAQMISAKLYWVADWQPGEAHCKQWRQGCRKLISNPESVKKHAMCKIVHLGQWAAIDAACPDPADPKGEHEAYRVQKIRHDDINALNVEIYDGISVKDFTPDQQCAHYRQSCASAGHDAGLLDPSEPTGLCYIEKQSNGEYIAYAACIIDNVGTKLGWTRKA